MRDLSKDRSPARHNSATVKPWTLEQLVEGCERAGIHRTAAMAHIVQAGASEKGRQHEPRRCLHRDLVLPRPVCFPAADEAADGPRSTTTPRRR
jgi:hypothetical protein